MLWTFEPSVELERQHALLSLGSFDDVVALVERGQLDELYLESKSRGECAGAVRLLCVIRVGSVAYDAFLNAPVGLRAQYAISPAAGESAGRALCDRLRPRLLAHPKLADLPGADHILAQRSIGSVEARVWVNDRDWSSAERPGLRYEPWAKKASAAREGTAAEQQARGAALNGVLAPQGTVLEFKGGWFNRQGEPCVDSSKAVRSTTIHDYGCA